MAYGTTSDIAAYKGIKYPKRTFVAVSQAELDDQFNYGLDQTDFVGPCANAFGEQLGYTSPREGDLGVTLGQIELSTGEPLKYMAINGRWVRITKDIVGARRTPYNIYGTHGSSVEGYDTWDPSSLEYVDNTNFVTIDGTVYPDSGVVFTQPKITKGPCVPSRLIDLDFGGKITWHGGHPGKNFPPRVLSDHVHGIPAHIRSLNGYYEHLGVYKLNTLPLGTFAYSEIGQMFEFLEPTSFACQGTNPNSYLYPGFGCECDSCRPVKSPYYSVFMKTSDKHECTCDSLVLWDITWGPSDNQGRNFNLGLTTWISLVHCGISAYSPAFSPGAKWFPYEPCLNPPHDRIWADFWDAGWTPKDPPICIQCCDNILPVVTWFQPGMVPNYKRFVFRHSSLWDASNYKITGGTSFDFSDEFAARGLNYGDYLIAGGANDMIDLRGLYGVQLTEDTSQLMYGFWGADASAIWGPDGTNTPGYDPMIVATEVGVYTPITIDFSKPINRYSVISDPTNPNWSFQVFGVDAISGDATSIIDGSLEWTDDSMTVQFFPYHPWDGSSTYLVRLEGCVIQDGPSVRLEDKTTLVYTDVLSRAYFDGQDLYTQVFRQNISAYMPVSWPALVPLVTQGWDALNDFYSAMHNHLDVLDAINDVLDNFDYAYKPKTVKGARGNHLVGSVFTWGQWGLAASTLVPALAPPGSTQLVTDLNWGTITDQYGDTYEVRYPGENCDSVDNNVGVPARLLSRFEFKFRTSSIIKSTWPIGGDAHVPHNGIIKLEYFVPMCTEVIEDRFEEIFQLVGINSEINSYELNDEDFWLAVMGDATWQTRLYRKDPLFDGYTMGIAQYNYSAYGAELIPIRLVSNTPYYTLIEVDTDQLVDEEGRPKSLYDRRLYGNRWHCLRINHDELMKQASAPAVAPAANGPTTSSTNNGQINYGDCSQALTRDYFLPFRTSPFFAGTWPNYNADNIHVDDRIVLFFNHGVDPESVVLKSVLGYQTPMGVRDLPREYYPNLGLWSDSSEFFDRTGHPGLQEWHNVLIYDQGLPIFGYNGTGKIRCYYRGEYMQDNEFVVVEELDDDGLPIGKGCIGIIDFTQNQPYGYLAVFTYVENGIDLELTLSTSITADNARLFSNYTIGEPLHFNPFVVKHYTARRDTIPYPWDGDIAGWNTCATAPNKDGSWHWDPDLPEDEQCKPLNIFAIDGSVYTFMGQDSTDVRILHPWSRDEWWNAPASLYVYECETDKWGDAGLHDQTQLLSGMISFGKDGDDRRIFNFATPNYYMKEPGDEWLPDDGADYMDWAAGEITRVIFTPLESSKLKENTEYALVVTNDIKSIYGMPGCSLTGDPAGQSHLMHDYTCYFSTGGLIDFTVPNDNDMNINLDTTIEVHFRMGMEAGSINSSSVYLKDDAGKRVPASVYYEGGLNMAVLTPANPLQADVRYYCTVTPAACSNDSRRFFLKKDYTFSFLTMAGFVLGFEVVQ